MNRKNFIDKLPIGRTDKEKGKGVSLNLDLYVYPDGHGNLFCSNNSKTGHKTAKIGFPSACSLETIGLVIDIIRKMEIKAKRIRKSN